MNSCNEGDLVDVKDAYEEMNKFRTKTKKS